MDRAEMERIFEAFFEKYKKTEGDRTSWSAHWTEPMPDGVSVEINMTKCPAGTRFKVFREGKKLGELEGWEAFHAEAASMVGDSWDAETFFSGMASMT